jgi:glutaredoxin-related protein|tara:strand:- start:586 stop:1125 length:540 start_codon:yes stop_codon:yes gene_type:complete
MALFGSARDASLIRHINNELIVNLIDIEIELYKLVLEDTRENLYGESDQKKYYNPIKIPCLIQKDEKTVIGDDYGIDSTRTGIFAFSRDYLKDRTIIFEIGDVLNYDNEFYEVDAVHGSNYWGGRNPSTDLGYTSAERSEFGYSVEVRVEAHITQRNKLNLVEVRTGGINQEYQLPKNL